MSPLQSALIICIYCSNSLPDVVAFTSTDTFWTTLTSTMSTITPLLQISGNIYRIDTAMTIRDIVLNVTEFTCGYQGLCNGSVSQDGTLCSFECQPCQCDDRCHFYGDCCPDLLFLDSDNTVSEAYPHLICSEDKWTTWLDFPNIFMVGRCPPNSDPSIRQKCEFADINIKKEATPVSAVGSNVTYRNSFCAECHNIEDYEGWIHEVTCSLWSTIQFATSKADLWRIVVDDPACEIVTKPPAFGEVRNCYPVIYTSCNATGNAMEYQDPVLKRLCEIYSHPIHYYGIQPRFDSYRNVFCPLCDGVLLDEDTKCSRVMSPSVPFPLNLLLNFGEDIEIEERQVGCKIGQVFDPLLVSCRNLSCPLRRALVGDDCEEIFSTARGLGIAIDVVLHRVNNSRKVATVGFLDAYLADLHLALGPLSPYLIHKAENFFFSSEPQVEQFSNIEMVHVHADIVSLTNRSLLDLESVLMGVMKTNFTLTVNGNSILFNSTPISCLPYKPPHPFRILANNNLGYYDPLSSLNSDCRELICENVLRFEPVQMRCPYLQYNLTEVDFTFDVENNNLYVGDKIAYLTPYTFMQCGDLLKICASALEELRATLTPNASYEEDLVLSIVSLVCNCLSLIGLSLTFIVYVIVSKLRTLPGMNTMALVLNLFLAQLLFLTTSNRTSNILLCQVFGVLIHYFWLTSFAWMSTSAYHMFTVFTRLRAHDNTTKATGRFVRYCLFSNLSPTVVISSCLAMHFIRSEGIESGYGGRICFMNNPLAVGVFFAGPICLMLVLNAFFFTKTVIAIRSVPDMKTSKNKNNKGHLSVYIKLSLLFGFTWVFGILAQVILSDILTYVFVILTGSQGLLLFVAYCVNRRCWEMLKQAVLSKKSNNSSTNVTSNISISR